MTETTCPRCGREARGNFCSWCGATLEGGPCPSCGAEPEPGARFCNTCGTALAGEAPGAGAAGAAAGGRGAVSGVAGGGEGASAGARGDLGWWVAGAVMVALIAAVALPIVMPDDGGGDGGAPATGATGSGAGGGVDLGSMTPRQAADRLYSRVMAAAESGDSAQVTQFLPMALSAYEMARPLDADGLFHLALLQRTGGDFEGALATARQALEDDADHLLNLAAAAEAAAAMGDSATARDYYGHMLEVWDEERANGLQEYELHRNMLPGLREEAEAFMGG